MLPTATYDEGTQAATGEQFTREAQKAANVWLWCESEDEALWRSKTRACKEEIVRV
jgi:hypothetical protein